MKIKITEPNLDAVQAALDAANGRAHAPTRLNLEQHHEKLSPVGNRRPGPLA